MFRKIVRYFGPEWGAAVMGTAALSIALQLMGKSGNYFAQRNILQQEKGYRLWQQKLIWKNVPGANNALARARWT